MTEEYIHPIRQAGRGDRSAMQTILDRWRPYAFATALRILDNSDDAEDVCQNALLELSLRLAEIRDHQAFPAFVRQVVLHQCFDFRRRKATRRSGARSWDDMDQAAEEEEVADRLALWTAIEALPEAERETLVMDYVQGHRHDEIAELFKVSVATVRSRLQSAKRRLRQDLRSLQQDPTMQTEPIIHQLIESVHPGAIVDSVEVEPETWVPYAYRISISKGDATHVLVARNDVDAEKARLLSELKKAGIAIPYLLARPTSVAGTPWSIWQEPNGQNLSRWTMDGTYHRFRTATDIALEALDELQGFTNRAREIGLDQETLQDRFARLLGYEGFWTREDVFRQALETLGPYIAEAENRLVYTHYLHFFPNLLRIHEGRLGEIVWPFGRLEDPLLGLSMVWIYDCYPFVHTGFVEQYLVRHNVSREDFALRLAVQSLTILVREAVESPDDGNAKYREHLLGLLGRALSWLKA